MRVDRTIFGKLEGILDAPDSLRDARVAPYNRFKLSKLEIERDQERIQLHKGDDSKWRWQSMDGPAMPSEEVNALLDAIEGLRAERYEDEAPDTETANPRVTLSEGEAGEGPTVTLSVVGDGRFLSSRSAALYIVSAGAAEEFSEALAGITMPRAEPEPASEDETQDQGEKETIP